MDYLSARTRVSKYESVSRWGYWIGVRSPLPYDTPFLSNHNTPRDNNIITHRISMFYINIMDKPLRSFDLDGIGGMGVNACH
jgi:hypothetical protein